MADESGGFASAERGSAQYKPPAYADEHNAEFLGLNIGPSRYDCDGVTFLYPGWEND